MFSKFLRFLHFTINFNSCNFKLMLFIIAIIHIKTEKISYFNPIKVETGFFGGIFHRRGFKLPPVPISRSINLISI